MFKDNKYKKVFNIESLGNNIFLYWFGMIDSLWINFVFINAHINRK